MTRKDSTLEDLEAQIAYNEKTINDLSEVVVSQGQQIEKIRAELEVLGREILRLTEGEAGSH